MHRTNGMQLLRMSLQCHKIENDLALLARLTVNEFHCLLQIYLECPCCVGKLTSLLGIGGTSTSKLLRSLDHRGLLSRTLAQSDRRQEKVQLTESGFSVVSVVLEHADAIVEQIRQKIPADKYECFTRCLDLFPVDGDPPQVLHPSATKTHQPKGESS